jgi:hypothetical protein
MKTTLKLLLVGILAVLRCSLVNAQIIYSNNFSLGGTGNISNTPPTVANNYAGGTNTAAWNDVLGTHDSGSLQANGLDNTTLADSWLLPFTPQSGHIYLLTATVTFTSDPGNWVALGFSQNNPTNLSTGARFADSAVNGYDFIIARAPGANEQWFSGPHATPAAGLASSNAVNALGTWTMQMVLNTLGNQWTAACFVNGTQFGTNFTFTSNPPIAGVGMSQTTLTAPNGVQWNDFSLITSLTPFVAQQPALLQTVNGGTVLTNKVTVVADTNGGPLSYQWYFNGTPLTNDAAISGAETNVLSINPVLATNAGNYFVIVTNNFGAVTSSVANVTVLTTPVITTPANSTNLITLFAGSGSFLGSSPTFSVLASGAPPLAYQWQTNGVVVSGATNATFGITNCQSDSPTNITAIVSNAFGQATNTWLATYVATPTGAYPQAVLASQPLDFWRLNEPADDTNLITYDYQSGNNGVYTNVTFAQAGYNSAEPTETSVAFGPGGVNNSYSGQIQGVDFAVTNGANAQFTVEAWVLCEGGAAGAPVITKGTYNSSDAFALNLDAGSQNFQFYVRTANGTVYKADSTVPPDNNWHYLVGVCDEANSNLSFYIDGALVAATNTPALAHAGEFETTAPVSIGATTQAAGGGYSLQLFGFIDDVAAYRYALSAGEVAGHFAATGGTVPISVIPQPPANFVYQANKTLTIPVTAAGQPPIGYYWTNVTTGVLLNSGSTNVYENLNATLTIPNAPGSLSGDQLELVVTNGTGSFNAFVSLFSPAPPVTLDYSDPILYTNNFDGGNWSLAGNPLTAANALVGGSNTTWVNALGTNDTGILMANGTSATTAQDSWELPFTPHAGYVYTVSGTVTFSGDPGTWVGIGFAQRIPTNAAVGFGRFSDGGTTPPQQGPNGYDWMILTESTGNVQYFAGAGGAVQITNKSPFFTAGAGTHTVQVILDTTGAKWVAYAFVDGVAAGTNTYASIPPIGAVGITQNNLSAPGNVQWVSFGLSQIAPGGVPPYLFTPVPTNATVQADAPLSISTSAFGSAPFGFYWSNTNTAAVLASGTSSDMVPLSANLSVADVPGSWNGNTLSLVVTNAYGTNISLVTLTVVNPINGQSTNIVATATNNNLYLTWPADHMGWTLQGQTNASPAGLGTNWVDVTGSTSTNQIVIPVNPTNGSVFYRMILK